MFYKNVELIIFFILYRDYMNMERTNLRMEYKDAIFVLIIQANIVKNVAHIIVAKCVKKRIGQDIKLNVNRYRNYFIY